MTDMGSEISSEIVRIGGLFKRKKMTMRIKKRKPIIAALLSSTVPGLGQAYNGQIIKGGIFFLATFLLLFFLSLTGLQFQFYGMIALILLVLFFWMFITGEAFFAAVKIKETTLKQYNKWYIYLLLALLAFGIDIITTDFFVNKVLSIQSYKFVTKSMQPTLLKGDYIMVNLKYFKTKDLQRGDLVIFKYPKEPSKDFLKRVIAMEGDKLEIKNKQVYINDKPITEDYKIHLDSMVISKKDDSPYYDSMRDNFGPEHVPSDHCFVLGDNRDRSLDSRYWGYLPLHNIKGKAAYVYWSKDILRIGMKLK